ncbi:hypothetical protein SRHO_G00076010 [Serrasalmus rhombeus]
MLCSGLRENQSVRLLSFSVFTGPAGAGRWNRTGYRRRLTTGSLTDELGMRTDREQPAKSRCRRPQNPTPFGSRRLLTRLGCREPSPSGTGLAGMSVIYHESAKKVSSSAGNGKKEQRPVVIVRNSPLNKAFGPLEMECS